MNFWQQLKRPFLALAPLDDVTDVVFREVVAETARPDVFFTEFTNCDALDSAGRETHMQRLRFTEKQRPIVAQIWGHDPATHYKAAQLVRELGFDGVDINMGCPDKAVMKSGCGSALINTPEKAHEIIAATQEGAGDLPVSVKTRLGVLEDTSDTWIPFLLEHNLATLTLHARTAKQMSDVPAQWEAIGRAVQMRDVIAPDTLFVGNGDVQSREQAEAHVVTYGVDGVMVGRGIFHDPWIFRQEGTVSGEPPERIELLRRHLALWDKEWKEAKSFHVMKKFLKMYISGFNGAARLRANLMRANTAKELLDLMDKNVPDQLKP